MTHTKHSSATWHTGLALSLLSVVAGCIGSIEPPMAPCDDCDTPSRPTAPDRPADSDITPRLDISGADHGTSLSATLSTTTLRLRRGTETALEVHVDRGDFEGEIAVWTEGLPGGVVVDAMVLPGSVSSGRLSIVATEAAMVGGPFELSVLVGTIGDVDPVELPARVVVAANPGRLDESFGEGGVVTIVGTRVDFDQVAVDNRGRTLVAGRELEPGSLFLERLDADGSLDESYDGAVPPLPDDMPVIASRMVLVGDEARVMVRAGSTADGDAQVGLAAFDADGHLDGSIGGEGIVPILALGSREPRSLGLAAGEGSLFFRVDDRLGALGPSGVTELTLPDGSRDSAAMAYGDHTLTFGVVDTDPMHPAMLERVHTAGGRDERFGNGGVVRGRAERDATIQSETSEVVLLGDGSGYAAGNRIFEAGASGEVVRFTAEGHIDSRFGDEGRLVFDDERVHAIEVDVRGGVIVLTEHWPSFERRIWRFDATGELDLAFGTGGFIELGAVAAGAIRGMAHDVTAERIVACGPVTDGWRCARFWL